ncbi:MAG TPA: 16S rRNA (adenine(1518)-N(6)/adenine(1519)-N(6))-dimethyltransferase RsmA [Saprospiraceae bacterium]|nr:16S rRNA (adenine(1518)-N(6)/adenine(1519)-N(6))-dimethyltransferase RsmA [Saprospiraceae bacterium]
MKAKKSYGQHFLINENVAKSIVDKIPIEVPGDNVLEVGPGKGVLTKYLLRLPINLKAVEADQDMIAFLKCQYPDMDNILIHKDFLKLDLGSIFNFSPFTLIGNFPYNISSQILFRMIGYREFIPQMIGMFQREVAERIVAPPGNKTRGSISVLIQAYYEGKIFKKVNPGSFSPPPKVQSAVIHLTRKKNNFLPCNESLFKSIVKISFGQRRKMLRNTLKGMIDSDHNIFKDEIFSLRPEQLSLNQFISLTQQIEEIQKENQNGKS